MTKLTPDEIRARVAEHYRDRAALKARLRDVQKELDGERVKVRLPSPLLYRLRRCAAAFEVGLSEFVNSSCRAFSLGKFPRVPNDEKAQVGTREESETVWVRLPAGFDSSARNLRAALDAAASWYEPRIKPRPAVRLPVEGVDYILLNRRYTRIDASGRILP